MEIHWIDCPFCFTRCEVQGPRERGGYFKEQYCRKCNSRIPEEALWSELFPIVVVGPSRSGKTHFLTVLAHLLMEGVVWPTYWTVSRIPRISAYSEKDGADNADLPSDDDFVNFENQLYPQRGAGRILRQTDRRGDDNLPLSLLIHISYDDARENRRKEPRKKRDVLVAITDTAGEDLTRTGWQDVVKKYPVLRDDRAKAMIALVDPAELVKVRGEIASSPESAEEFARRGIELKVLATLESVLAIPEIRKRMRSKPLAVCMTKTDALIEMNRIDSQDPLAGSDDALTGPAADDGILSLSALADVSERTEAFLTEMDGGPKISKSASLFKYRAFFAVDALGAAIASARTLDGERVMVGTPQPRRVLDPFLWALWQYGLCGGK